MEEYRKTLCDSVNPTVSLLLSAKTKVEHNCSKLDIKEHPEIINSFQNFIEQLNTVYSAQSLAVAGYFDPRVSKNAGHFDNILAELKLDYEKLQTNKSGLEMLLENDDKGL